MWAKRGTRPTAVKQTRYEWVYLYAAVEPASGQSVALLAPQVNTGNMNVFLEMLAAELRPDEHAVQLMDQAGWHKSQALRVPEGITILHLPPYSPDPVERLWAYLRSHYLSNRAYEGYEHLLDASTHAWQQLEPQRLRSLCACPYLTPEFRR